MFGFIILTGVLFLLLWIGFKVTGAMVSALVWMFVKLPLALVFFFMGLAFMVTILLIPLGKGCLHIAGELALP